MKFKLGDLVRPKAEWRDVAPSGRIRKIEPWGDDGALYVGKARHAFAGYVFELASDRSAEKRRDNTDTRQTHHQHPTMMITR